LWCLPGDEGLEIAVECRLRLESGRLERHD
jgi:hypothetical protein